MAWARAQAVTGAFAVTNASTIAKAYGSNVTLGNTSVALVQWGSSSQTCTVADNLGNTYTPIAASLATNVTNAHRSQIFTAPVTVAGACTVTATCSGNNTERELYIHEYSGLDNAALVDVGAAANGNSANPSTTITTGGQPRLIVAAVLCVTGTATAGATYTSGFAQNGNISQDKNSATTGSNSVPFVNASGSQWVISAAALNESSGAAAVVRLLGTLGAGK